MKEQMKAARTDLAKGSLADRSQQVEVPQVHGPFKVDLLLITRDTSGSVSAPLQQLVPCSTL